MKRFRDSVNTKEIIPDREEPKGKGDTYFLLNLEPCSRQKHVLAKYMLQVGVYIISVLTGPRHK